jgi:hypothetical protein
VRRQHLPVGIIVVLAAGFAAASAVGLILAGLGLIVLYLVSIRLHPRMLHRRCAGSGRTHDWIFPWVYHRCRGCGGSGRMIRYGSARWGLPHIRQEADSVAKARAAARSGHIWR